MTACFWAPLRAPDDIVDTRAGHVLDRFGDLLDGYGAPADVRREVAAACADANDWIAAIIHDASLRGHPAFGRVWAAQAQMYERAAEWLRCEHGRTGRRGALTARRPSSGHLSAEWSAISDHSTDN